MQYLLISTNARIRYTPHPHPPPQGGRVRVGVNVILSNAFVLVSGVSIENRLLFLSLP